MMLLYNELASDLVRIRRFLTASSEEKQSPDQRRFAYIACISSLYSTFENFAEQLAFRFGQLMLDEPNACTIGQMSGLRQVYVRNASTLFGKKLGVGRYEGITNLDIAKSLASVLDESCRSSDLRLELVALHNSNLRWDALEDLFRWAEGDLLNKIRLSDPIRMWMSTTPDVTQRTLATVR